MSSKHSKKNVSWVDQYLPKSVQPYAKLARLDKPIGSWLFAWPALWAVALSANPGKLPDISLLLIFAWWTVFIRGAACTINDYFDMDFDKKVERCKSRPLPSGLVSPAKGLLWFIIEQFSSVIVLYPVNRLAFEWGVYHVPLVVAYPLMKRITYWPQAFLGIMINWGVIVGSAAAKGSIDVHIATSLCFSGFFWTLIYDTIYAHQDKADDVKAGVKSTALRMGDKTIVWLTAFAIPCIGGLVAAGIYAEIGWLYFAFVVVAAGHLAWQIFTVDLSSPADCMNKFVSNQWYGAIVFLGIVLGRFYP
ncbi:hypothetical protein Leryth_003298 [Lithospermum erythrorhizon]|nr:hypothetical protein Leryth_003298 [Lithospermum erythrorhizon]